MLSGSIQMMRFISAMSSETIERCSFSGQSRAFVTDVPPDIDTAFIVLRCIALTSNRNDYHMFRTLIGPADNLDNVIPTARPHHQVGNALEVRIPQSQHVVNGVA